MGDDRPMERAVLVHGSVSNGRATWVAQRRGLRDHLELVVLERPGFPPGPDVDRVDFVEHARWVAARLRPGDHLVAHSYGGVIALLAAAEPGVALASLTVLEPPCTSVAQEHPAVAAFVRDGQALWEHATTDDPEGFLRAFLRYVGSDFDPPSPLHPDLAQGARTLAVERGPWEAEIPLERLRTMGPPALVVSGAHHPAFDAICDALEQGLDAERLVLPGYGHAPQLHPAFNDALLAFVARHARTDAATH
jgi:pimeloyl-ACP methyl ester carboxylesterase